MGSFRFEGRSIAFEDGDTIASALFRAGVRTFSRSFKYRRRRGLYCLTGDCPNCLVTVDGEPAVRSCTTPARDGQGVRREKGFPSTDRDLTSGIGVFARFLGPGFYYKTFVRPAAAWPLAERLIRRATGLGRLDSARPAPTPTPTRHVRVDVVVIGAGLAGLVAALEQPADATVLVCDEGPLGAGAWDVEHRAKIAELAATFRGRPRAELVDRGCAIGIYDGPTVVITTPGRTIVARTDRVVVATGAVELHEVFSGNDLPGVWLGRAAALMAVRHGILPARRAVVIAATDDALARASVLARHGVRVGVVWTDPARPMPTPPAGVTVIAERGKLVRAIGRRRVDGVEIEAAGATRRIACDGLVVDVGRAPRDSLRRMFPGGDVSVVGDAAEAEVPAPVKSEGAGFLCLCEDVRGHDLSIARREGFGSSELMKRYSTVTMGPCQGALCARHLARASTDDAGRERGTRPTARPPARPASLASLAGVPHHHVLRTGALDERHRALGATMGPSGGWLRPARYGNVHDEYAATRDAVSLIDVSTLGSFKIVGGQATELVDLVLPGRIRSLAAGRVRYTLFLDEAGYVFDDGLVSADDDGGWSLTTTTSGADAMLAWLRGWAFRAGLRAHVVDRTASRAAIAVSGPASRALLERACLDDVSAGVLPYLGRRRLDVAGVACDVVRVGFVGELSYELHHDRRSSGVVWDALLEAGRDLGVRPAGLDALDLLRLEKGHIYVGQDSLPDDTPDKLGLGGLVDPAKTFVGSTPLGRIRRFPQERRATGLGFDGDADPRTLQGAPIVAGGEVVGRVTSCARSPKLGRTIGLGWVRLDGGAEPTGLSIAGTTVRLEATPFYDPEGRRVRA